MACLVNALDIKPSSILTGDDDNANYVYLQVAAHARSIDLDQLDLVFLVVLQSITT